MQNGGEARHWHRGGGLIVVAVGIIADEPRSLASPVVAAAVVGGVVGGEGRGGELLQGPGRRWWGRMEGSTWCVMSEAERKGRGEAKESRDFLYLTFD